MKLIKNLLYMFIPYIVTFSLLYYIENKFSCISKLKNKFAPILQLQPYFYVLFTICLIIIVGILITHFFNIKKSYYFSIIGFLLALLGFFLNNTKIN